MSEHLFGPDDSGGGSGRGGDDLDRLRRLADLHREGVLTDDEFAAKKRELLGETAPARPPRRKLSKRSKVTAMITGALLLLGGGGTAAALKIQADSEAKRERKALVLKKKREADRKAAAERAAERAVDEAAELQKIEDDLEIGMRKSIVRSLRKSVSKDFKSRVADGLLDGPVLSTTCDPVDGGVEDLEQKTGKYECLVATEETATGTRGIPSMRRSTTRRAPTLGS